MKLFQLMEETKRTIKKSQNPLPMAKVKLKESMIPRSKHVIFGKDHTDEGFLDNLRESNNFVYNKMKNWD